MAASLGPNLIEDGLVLSLDAGDINSVMGATVEVLVVAGGGGGGMDMGGGGGGGGVIYNSSYAVTQGTPITVTVGNGGYGAPAAGTYRGDGVGPQPTSHQYTVSATQGGNSVFGSLTAIGGGFGASSYYGYLPNSGIGGTGGSGGGCSGYTHGAERYVDGTNGSTANNTAGQGFPGGNSGDPTTATDNHYSGGGGGAGGRGTSGPNHVGPNGVKPNGGPGILYPTMSPYYFAGGGGGAAYTASTGGDGGIGGGGGGAVGVTVGGAGLNNGSPGGGGSPVSQTNTPGGNAGANTGGGGGGGSHYNSNNKGGDGGSGIVIVRYSGPQKATGGTVSTVAGYTIHTFTSSGTFTPNSNWYDSSGNSSNGSLIGSIAFTSNNGGGIIFDSLSKYVTLPASSLAFGSGQFTIETWVYSTSAVTNNVIYASQSSNASGFIALYYPNGSGFALTDFNGSVRITTTHQTAVSQNTWYHVVGTRNSSNQYVVYVNGVASTTNNTSSLTLTASAPQIASNPATNGERFTGIMSNLRLYNRELSAAEILQNYNSRKSRFGL